MIIIVNFGLIIVCCVCALFDAYFLRPHTFEDPSPRLAQETAPRTPPSLTPAEETAPRTVISGPHTMRGDHLSDEKDLV